MTFRARSWARCSRWFRGRALRRRMVMAQFLPLVMVSGFFRMTSGLKEKVKGTESNYSPSPNFATGQFIPGDKSRYSARRKAQHQRRLANINSK
jgi:hypothetical protein